MASLQAGFLGGTGGPSGIRTDVTETTDPDNSKSDE
jgi:hypothetical protein